MIDLAGIRFSIEPAEALNRPQLEVLDRLGVGPMTTSRPVQRMRLLLVDEPPFSGDDPGHSPDFAPAVVRSNGGQIRVSHARFSAEIDLSAGTARLHSHGGAIGFETTLRVAMCCALPQTGGLPLHAAGTVVAGQGLVFFGPSGAGKSTLASQAPWPVLSDELVAVRGEPFELAASGFWGELDGGRAARETYPLRALVRLDRGPRFELEPLDADSAFRSLLHVIMVPGEPGLWGEAMGVAARLACEVPTYRMAWSPAEPPWRAIAGRFGDAAEQQGLMGEGRKAAATASPKLAPVRRRADSLGGQP
jgi:hypothetical protein